MAFAGRLPGRKDDRLRTSGRYPYAHHRTPPPTTNLRPQARPQAAAEARSLAANQQLPPWHITRREPKTGAEDDRILQIKSAFRPVLSPDGKQVLYVTRYETESGLRLRNLESGEDHWVKYPVTRDDQESLFTRDVFPGYAFLPGGKEIVYNQDGKIKRLD